jgi:hypothetical protein
MVKRNSSQQNPFPGLVGAWLSSRIRISWNRLLVQASMWKTTGARYRLQPPTGDRKTAAATGMEEDGPLISQERYGFSGNK